MNNQTAKLTDAELNTVSGGWGIWYNQSQTLSSNVQKKADDTVSGQLQKIG